MRIFAPGMAVLVLLSSLLLASCSPASAPSTVTPTAAAKAGVVPTAAVKSEATKPAPAATPAPTASAPDKIKIATTGVGLAEMAQQLAKKKGFYSKENLDAEITQVAPDVSVKGLVGGELTFITGIGSPMRGAAQGLQVKGLMTVFDKPYHILVVRPEIKEFKDLKGKLFAISAPADSTAQMMGIAMKKYGMDPDKDITMVSLGANPARLAGLISGVAQATLLEPIYAIQAEQKGMKRLLPMAEIMDVPLTGMVASDKTIKERPDMVLRTVRATVKATQYMKDPQNKDEMIAYMVSDINASKEDAIAIYPDVIRALSSDGIPSEASIMREVQTAVETMGAKPNTTLTDVFDYSFVKKVKSGS